MKNEDLYKKYIRKSDTVTMEVSRFYIKNIPVCMSWYGDKDHEREACQFLLSRRFGTIRVCGLTGEDLPNDPDVINRVPEDCPLHKKER